VKESEKFKILASIAWKNVWKNRRRTILTLLTISAGASMLVLMNAFANGSHMQMIEDAVSVNTGHIQIAEKGWYENQSIDYAFFPEDNITEVLDREERVTAWSPRISAGALLASGGTTTAALIQGVDYIKEPQVTILHKKIREGKYLTGIPGEAVIGSTLAKRAGISTGDEFSFISQGFDGSIAAAKLTVTGIFTSGNPELDSSLCLINLDEADAIFSMMGYVNAAALNLKNTGQSSEVKNSLKEALKDERIEVLAWDRLMPELVQFIVMDDVSGWIFNLILFMIIAFGILNTMQMSVFERIREFGVMLAVGTRPGEIRGMIQLESCFISLSGIFLGCVIGSALSLYFQYNPLDYSNYAKEMEVWGISTVIFPARLTAANLAAASVITFTVSQFFTMFPAKHASQMDPVRAIRHL